MWGDISSGYIILLTAEKDFKAVCYTGSGGVNKLVPHLILHLVHMMTMVRQEVNSTSRNGPLRHSFK